MNMNRPDFLFVGNGSYLNRGCEAIVRGTARILRNAFDNPRIINANFDVTKPVFLPNERDTSIIHQPIQVPRQWSPKWIAKNTFRFTIPKLEQQTLFGSIKNAILASEAVLSIGGDNYTLDYGVPHPFIALDSYVKRLERPLIIWGASIGPFDSIPKFAKRILLHLRSDVTAIFVREEVTRQYLLKHGISENAIPMADPAFVMEAESVSEDKMGLSLPNDAIGLNISPLMAKWVTHGNVKAWMLRSVEIVRNMRRSFDMPIVLIPHDTRPHTNDYKFMREVLENLGADCSGILLLPEDLTAAETKWIISRMNCMIAARTHASIAALSSCVPTVSLAYSHKAEGINKQIFGHTDFLLTSNNITENSVAQIVEDTLKRKDEIRDQLRKTVPKVQRSALNAGQILVDLLKAFPRGASGIKERGKKYEKE